MSSWPANTSGILRDERDVVRGMPVLRPETAVRRETIDPLVCDRRSDWFHPSVCWETEVGSRSRSPKEYGDRRVQTFAAGIDATCRIGTNLTIDLGFAPLLMVVRVAAATISLL